MEPESSRGHNAALGTRVAVEVSKIRFAQCAGYVLPPTRCQRIHSRRVSCFIGDRTLSLGNGAVVVRSKTRQDKSSQFRSSRMVNHASMFRERTVFSHDSIGFRQPHFRKCLQSLRTGRSATDWKLNGQISSSGFLSPGSRRCGCLLRSPRRAPPSIRIFRSSGADDLAHRSALGRSAICRDSAAARPAACRTRPTLRCRTATARFRARHPRW